MPVRVATHGARTIRSPVRTNGLFVRTNGLSVRTNQPPVRTNEPSVRTNGSSARMNGPFVTTNGSSVRTNGRSACPNPPSLRPRKPPKGAVFGPFGTRKEGASSRGGTNPTLYSSPSPDSAGGGSSLAQSGPHLICQPRRARRLITQG